MTYSEKLKNPLWQKKRLKILERDEFTCQYCSNIEDELHVHHLKYTGQNPWDESDENLITLCKYCHKYVALGQKEFQELSICIIRDLSLDHFYETLKILKSIYAMKINPLELMVLGKIVDNFNSKDYDVFLKKYRKK